MRRDLEHWVSGYHGEDSMRDKAHQMIREEMAGARDGRRDKLLGGIPEAMSSPGHTKMRPFKHGGRAHHKGHKKNHYGIGGMIAGRMAAPLLGKIPVVGDMLGGLANAFGSFLPFEEGGHVSKKKGGRMHKLSHDQSNMHIPRRHKSKPINVETFEEAERLRHGGHAHKKHHSHHKGHKKHHYGRGGEILGKVASPLLNKIPYVGDALGNIASSFGHLLPFEEGGHAKKRGGRHVAHKRHHKASGGTIYEHHMVGEMKAKPHHFNYEGEMRGEHDISRPPRAAVSKRGLTDKNHSQMFERGGMVDKNRGQMFKQDGGAVKRAAGGVGKIRHEQATKRGQPKGGRHRSHSNMF